MLKPHAFHPSLYGQHYTEYIFKISTVQTLEKKILEAYCSVVLKQCRSDFKVRVVRNSD